MESGVKYPIKLHRRKNEADMVSFALFWYDIGFVALALPALFHSYYRAYIERKYVLVYGVTNPFACCFLLLGDRL